MCVSITDKNQSQFCLMETWSRGHLTVCLLELLFLSLDVAGNIEPNGCAIFRSHETGLTSFRTCMSVYGADSIVGLKVAG